MQKPINAEGYNSAPQLCTTIAVQLEGFFGFTMVSNMHVIDNHSLLKGSLADGASLISFFQQSSGATSSSSGKARHAERQARHCLQADGLQLALWYPPSSHPVPCPWAFPQRPAQCTHVGMLRGAHRGCLAAGVAGADYIIGSVV